jgi:potassium efflux system protein
MNGFAQSPLAATRDRRERLWIAGQRNLCRIALLCAVLVLLERSGQGHEDPVDSTAPRTDQSVAAEPSMAARLSEVEAARAAALDRIRTLAPAPTMTAADQAPTEPAGSVHALPVAAPAAEIPPADKLESSPSSPATRNTPLRAVLDERVRLLDDYDKVTRALDELTHPRESPRALAAAAAAEIRRLELVAKEASTQPESLLPPVFRQAARDGSRTLGVEMKHALEEVTEETKKWRLEADALTAQAHQSDSRQDKLRSERDKVSHELANLKATREEFESAVTDATSTASRQLARERLTNFGWRTRLENERLHLLEAQIAVESKLTEVHTLKLQVARLHLKIATTTLTQMNSRYSAAMLAREGSLKKEAMIEETRSKTAIDPLEKYQAERSAELLRLEAVVVAYEKLDATNPRPSYDEQKVLADHADDDFARIKELLADGSVSRLDAVRLNNEFRRIGPERDRLVKNELAAVESRIQFYEGELTGVEIDLMRDGMHDLERDLVRERVPRERWDEADAILAALEKRNHGLLIRQRDALDSLSRRNGHTLQQIVRRLDSLDREYGFIRTSIFWVRDQEPIGLSIVTDQAREFRHLASGLARLAGETLTNRLWSHHPSPEFLIAAVSALALPALLLRLRALLKGRMARTLPVANV